MFCKQGIYAIINTVTKERYVGSSKNIHRRVRGHFSQLRSGKHHNPKLQKSFGLFGEQAFSFAILEETPPGLDLLRAFNWSAEREDFHIKASNLCFNVAKAPAPMPPWFRVSDDGTGFVIDLNVLPLFFPTWNLGRQKGA